MHEIRSYGDRELVRSWASDIDDGAMKQAEKAARSPAVSGPIALMPDAHFGLGATIGSVIPTESAIIPAAVGVDLGCGMVAVETSLVAGDLPVKLDPILAELHKAIPAGFAKHDDATKPAWRWLEANPVPDPSELTTSQLRKIGSQLGTLGGGNHFVEICLDEGDRVWAVLHSGSRGIGNLLATRHIHKARALAQKLERRLEDRDLAYFLDSDPEFNAYIADMLWSQDYALRNRELMMDALLAVMRKHIPTRFTEKTRINCLAGDTGVMTKDGVFPIAKLAGTDVDLLTTGGQWVRAPIRSFGREQVMELTLSRSKVIKTIRATRTHRWFRRTRRGVVEEVHTDGLRPGDRLVSIFPLAPARLVDEQAVARGFVFGDGSKNKRRSVANFAGKKDEPMLGYFSSALPPRRYGEILRIHGLPLEWKSELPDIDASPDVLYGWLAGYFAADGDVDKTGRPTISSACRENLEYVRRIGDRIGVGTFGIRLRWRTGYGSAPSPLYLMGLMRGDLDDAFFLLPDHRVRFQSGQAAAERRNWNVLSVEASGTKEEEVFCAVVPGTHAFALEDNILTGNCHHNYTEREPHDGRTLWITRKGAIRARVGDRGIIPGSMGTGTYIVTGLGEPSSYHSASHGAGRRFGRKEAQRRFTATQLKEAMHGRTWQSNKASELIDESPMAYKDIDQVMRDQADLVSVEHVLHAVLNYKGTS